MFLAKSVFKVVISKFIADSTANLFDAEDLITTSDISKVPVNNFCPTFA